MNAKSYFEMLYVHLSKYDVTKFISFYGSHSQEYAQ